MMFMGLSGNGLGADNVWSTCARTGTSFDGLSIECLDSNDMVIATVPIGTTVPPKTGAASSDAQSSWWATALTALTKGVVSGTQSPAGSGVIPCVAPGVPANCNYTAPVVAEPWYTTPMGIGGIVLTLGLGYFLLKK